MSYCTGRIPTVLVTELCVLRTFGGVDFSLVFICAQSVSEFLWDRLRASIQFPVMPKRAQYARFSGECTTRYVPAWKDCGGQGRTSKIEQMKR